MKKKKQLVLKKDASTYKKEFEGFSEKMPMLKTHNTELVLNEKGIITTPAENFIHEEYINDCDIELAYDSLTQMERDLGPFHKVTRKHRKELQSMIKKYRDENIDKGIPPRLYFNHVKSSLSEIRQDKVEERVKTINGMIKYFNATNQEGAEARAKEILVANVRESEILSANINFWLERSSVQDYVNYVKFGGKRIAYFKALRDFPRVIPKEQLKILEEVKELNIFDGFEILYLDYSDDANECDSIETKVQTIEKDPILFGTIKEMPDRLYFITYWDDEYCDLSMKDLIEKVMEEDLGEFDFIKDSADFTKEDYLKIKEDVDRKHDQEAALNRGNRQRLGIDFSREKNKNVWESVKYLKDIKKAFVNTFKKFSL